MSEENPDHPAETDLVGAAWRRHISDDRQMLDRLVERYEEKHRRYHTVAHLDTVLRAVIDLANSERVDDLDAVVAAALYHDAIYEPASPANEHASARLARRDLSALGWPADRVDHVAEIIAATERHDGAPDIDHAVVFDADLSILGADRDTYCDYVVAVRAEYHHVDDDAWRTGRRSVLEALLDRSTIYATSTGRQRWERAARANLADELALLTD